MRESGVLAELHTGPSADAHRVMGGGDDLRDLEMRHAFLERVDRRLIGF